MISDQRGNGQVGRLLNGEGLDEPFKEGKEAHEYQLQVKG